MNSFFFEDVLETCCFHPSPEVNHEKKTLSQTRPLTVVLKSYPALQPLLPIPPPRTSMYPASRFLSNPSVTAKAVTLSAEKSASFLMIVILSVISLDAVSASGGARGQQRGKPLPCAWTTYNQPCSLLLRSRWIPCTETDF